MRGFKCRRVKKDSFNSVDLITFQSPSETNLPREMFTPLLVRVCVCMLKLIIIVRKIPDQCQHVNVALSWGILCNGQYGEMQSSGQAAPAPLAVEAA